MVPCMQFPNPSPPPGSCWPSSVISSPSSQHPCGALQVEGITLDVLRAALEQAKQGRRHILGEMHKCSPPPRKELSPAVPRIVVFAVQPDQIGMVIGPGGRNIKGFEHTTGAQVVVSVPSFGPHCY